MGPEPLPLKGRFFPKVALPTEPSGCMVWTAGRDRGGYGRFRVGDRTHKAHRVSYELFVGQIPAGLQIDHLCRNTSCVRPDHLEPVTARVNTLRGTSESAVNAVKTHCKNGHAFTPDNTYVTPDGRRKCRTCFRRVDLHRYHTQRSKRALAARAGGLE